MTERSAPSQTKKGIGFNQSADFGSVLRIAMDLLPLSNNGIFAEWVSFPAFAKHLFQTFQPKKQEER